jgi:DNA-directed RNA polymerase specialized sigma24 family protein
VTDAAPDAAEHAATADTLSMAFLMLLERLSPVQRAVFLLHEVFGYGYAEIGPWSAGPRRTAGRSPPEAAATWTA